MLGRHFIGLEREDKYIRLARKRISEVEPLSEEAAQFTPSKKGQPRVAFGSLVERGMVRAGTTLYDPGRRHAARVRSDGTLVCRDATGSIHQIGAHVQGAPACNGWTFWHFEAKGACAD